MIDNRTLTRRSVLLGMGTTAVIFVAHAAIAAPPGAYGETPQMGFLVDLSKCIGCEKCVIACREVNHTPEGAPGRRKVTRYFDQQGEEVFASTSCMHCKDPACVTVCPAGAISKGDGGIVAVDKERCIGCKYCYEACPYGVPHYLSTGMDKCDCCLGAGVAPGEQAYCARACIFGGLTYGTVEELKAKAPHAILIGEAGTPSCLVTSQELL